MSKLLPIVFYQKPILRQAAKDVLISEIKTLKVQELISNMKETLKNTPDGVGLAAPQVGESLRIFLVSEEAEFIDKNGVRKRKNSEEKETKEQKTEDQIEKKDWKQFVFINPVAKNISKKKVEYPEGCLSVPGKFGVVVRPEKITVEAYNEHGQKFRRGASKFLARVIQHELDHLNGFLFIDKVREFLKDQQKNNG